MHIHIFPYKNVSSCSNKSIRVALILLWHTRPVVLKSNAQHSNYYDSMVVRAWEGPNEKLIDISIKQGQNVSIM